MLSNRLKWPVRPGGRVGDSGGVPEMLEMPVMLGGKSLKCGVVAH